MLQHCNTSKTATMLLHAVKADPLVRHKKWAAMVGSSHRSRDRALAEAAEQAGQHGAAALLSLLRCQTLWGRGTARPLPLKCRVLRLSRDSLLAVSFAGGPERQGA